MIRNKKFLLNIAAFGVCILCQSYADDKSNRYADAAGKFYEYLSNSVKEEIYSKGAEKLIAKHVPGLSGKIGLWMVKKLSGVSTIIDIFTPTLVAPGTLPPQGSPAFDLGQCSNRVRNFVEYQYVISTWETNNSQKDHEVRRSHNDESYQFWMISRYDKSLNACNDWFKSGRTDPFFPS